MKGRSLYIYYILRGITMAPSVWALMGLVWLSLSHVNNDKNIMGKAFEPANVHCKKHNTWNLIMDLTHLA